MNTVGQREVLTQQRVGAFFRPRNEKHTSTAFDVVSAIEVCVT